jgi:predicted ATPase/class 3 adenylate cyclase
LPLRLRLRTIAVVSELPTGTVTFLFTDIDGSTRLLQRLGDRYDALLEEHHRVLRDAFSGFRGREMGTEGDAFFVVFRSAVDAVAAAVEAQRALASREWPDGADVGVRIGLHAGEAHRAADGYVGLDVHRAARIAAAAHGGQVLLSETTRSLVEHAVPPGVRIRDLGEHRLKDLARPERLYQLCVEGLRAEFPPLRTVDVVPNNLPTQLTSFLGRQRELEEVRRLLSEVRLLTLTGPGGTGKTRLGLQAAADLAQGFRDGVFFVPLAPITDPELLSSTILQAVEFQDTRATDPEQRLIEHLSERQVLLVLDNFEQILTGAPLIGRLLKAALGLKAIATSRAPLHIYGEHEYPVPPLALPDPAQLPAVESFSQYEAVALFIERAAAVKPDFKVTNENAPAVAAITARLDGLPLAIELAAARVKILPPKAMLARLEGGLDLLGGGASDLPSRQRTLRGAIAWSYDLLDPASRRLFARFSVFNGGALLEEAEAICGPADEMGSEILGALAGLVDHSLVRQEEQHDEPRFVMLETIREFGLERLAESGEAETIRRRHADVFLALVDRAEPYLTGADQKTWLDRLEHEHGNLRAALAWAIEHQEEKALRLAAALWRFWQMRGHLREGRQRLDEILALPTAPRRPALLARALEAAGGVAYWQGDMDAAQRFYEQALSVQRELRDESGIAGALYNLAFPYVVRQSDPREAEALVEEALAIYRRLNDRAGIAKCLWAMATEYFLRQEYNAALPALEESLEIFRELGDRFSSGWVLHTLGMTGVVVGEHDAARGRLREGLRLFAEVGDVSAIAIFLRDFVALARAEGDWERAIRLTAASESLQASSGTDLAKLIGELQEERAAATGVRPSEETAAAAIAAGKAMNVEEAVAYALENPGSPTVATPA